MTPEVRGGVPAMAPSGYARARIADYWIVNLAVRCTVGEYARVADLLP